MVRVEEVRTENEFVGAETKFRVMCEPRPLEVRVRHGSRLTLPDIGYEATRIVDPEIAQALAEALGRAAALLVQLQAGAKV